MDVSVHCWDAIYEICKDNPKVCKYDNRYETSKVLEIMLDDADRNLNNSLYKTRVHRMFYVFETLALNRIHYIPHTKFKKVIMEKYHELLLILEDRKMRDNNDYAEIFRHAYSWVEKEPWCVC